MTTAASVELGKPSLARPLVAVAAQDPLAPATFSGLSRRLFTSLADTGLAVFPLATRDLRWYDVGTGAVNLRGLAKGRFRGRRSPRVNPNWVWSRHGFERLSARFEHALQGAPAHAPLLQVGTQVRVPSGRRGFCVTDATVRQALAAGEFSVSFTKRRVAMEAVDCQAEVFWSCEKVFVLSRWAAESIVDDYDYPADRVVVLGAGANLETRLPRRYDATSPYVLFVGADWQQKGGPALLDAFRLARSRLPAARLVVVGCTPALDDPGVEVVGPLRRDVPAEFDRLLGLYAGAACVSIVPPFDAFPNVLLEAGYTGAPVVSTRVGSRPEVVLDGQTGLLVPPDDAGALADALVRVLGSVDEQQRMGTAAQQLVEQRYRWPLVAGRLAAEMGLEASPR